MTPEEHIALVRAHEDRVRDAKNDLFEVRRSMAAELGKHKPGDVVEVPRPASSFKGRKCRIIRAEGHISPYDEVRYLIRYYGHVLRKDGTETGSFVDWPEYVR